MPYSHEISSRMRPLRDFFITLFFILLGYQLVLDNWASLITPTLIFSAFILIGNPIIVLILMNLLGYTRKTGFLAGLTVAQISEFSLILVKLGFDMGYLSQEILSMVTLVGILTISGSTYMILYSERLFKFLDKGLSFLEIRKVRGNKKGSRARHYDGIIFGYRMAGPEVSLALSDLNVKFLVVEFNPDIIHSLEENKIPSEYGDASDIEFLEELPLADVKFVISTVSDFDTNYLITQSVRKVNKDAIIIIIADTLSQADDLYEIGATNIVLAHYVGAQQVSKMLRDYKLNTSKYEKEGKEHLEYLHHLGY